MGDKEKTGGELVRREAHGIEKRGGDLFRRGLASLEMSSSRATRREFEYMTVELDEYGEEIDRRCGKAWEVVEDLGDGVELQMVEIPGGSFWMGTTREEVELGNAWKYELPRHLVHVPPFLIGKYPVTQTEWQSVMKSLPDIEEKLLGGNRPVVNVSWNEAVEYCQQLTRNTGHAYRLPSEAEWEYAARAGTVTPFAFGGNLSTDIVNYDGSWPYGDAVEGVFRGYTVDVGSLGIANKFGLYDMHGNVWEWCEDEWHKNYDGAPTDGIAWKSEAKAARRVIRGGGWLNSADACRSALRQRGTPGRRGVLLGFRLSRTLPSALLP